MVMTNLISIFFKYPQEKKENLHIRIILTFICGYGDGDTNVPVSKCSLAVYQNKGI